MELQINNIDLGYLLKYALYYEITKKIPTSQFCLVREIKRHYYSLERTDQIKIKEIINKALKSKIVTDIKWETLLKELV